MRKEKKLFRFDNLVGSSHLRTLAGVDEAGRGPLAGPVVAGAVIFRHLSVLLPGLNDSKQLTPASRETLFFQIASQALVGIGVVSETVIDEINILQASRLAMRKAVLALTQTPSLLLIDGNMKLDLPLRQQSIVSGDSLSARIAAASIMAKVYRDHLMRKLDLEFPEYGFAEHKGYPTPQHLQILQIKGPSSIHRKTFRPVWELEHPAPAEVEK